VDTETVGLLSGALVAFAGFPYGVRVWQRKITAHPVTWALWSVVGFALLVTYHDAGATTNVWPAVFSFVNPMLIAVLAVVRRDKSKKYKLTWQDALCAVLALTSIAGWLLLKGSTNEVFMLYALCLAIAADVSSAVPTILFLVKEPMEDRPGAWVLFGIGYAVGMFAIEANTISNWLLPIWMVCAAFGIVALLVVPRVRAGVPVREWI